MVMSLPSFWKAAPEQAPVVGPLHLHVNLGEGCAEKLRENLGDNYSPKI